MRNSLSEETISSQPSAVSIGAEEQDAELRFPN